MYARASAAAGWAAALDADRNDKLDFFFFFQKQLYAYLIKFCTDFIAFLCIILSNDNFIRRTVKYSDVSGK